MPEQLLAVTTRSKLRSVRFFPSMLLATRRIRRQLAETDGLVRFASLTAGPTEFWTISVWRSRHAMQEFMRSDAHGELMWRSSRWLHSLWLMRWRPGTREVGSWSGVTMAPEQAPAPEGVPPEAQAFQEMLNSMPELRAAVNPAGAPTYESSQTIRQQRRMVERAGGVVVRLRASLPYFPIAVAELARLRRRMRAEGELLRSAVGVGRPGEVCLLGVLADRTGAKQAVDSPRVRRMAERWEDACWVHEWQPDNEFGHWDGLRVRRAPRPSKATEAR